MDRAAEFEDQAIREITGRDPAPRATGQPPARVRNHSSDDMTGPEFAEIMEPCAVVIRPDGSVDVYGYVGIVDQRADVATLTAEIRAKAEQIKAMRDDPNADTAELWALRDIRDAALDLADLARPAWYDRAPGSYERGECTCTDSGAGCPVHDPLDRRSCSCGEAWADEPGHDDGPPISEKANQ